MMSILVGTALAVIIYEFYAAFRARHEEKIWENLNKKVGE